MIEKEIILKSLAKKHGISMKQARDIEDSIRFVAEIMSNADRDNLIFPSVRIPALGLFHCPDYYKQKILRNNEFRKNRALKEDTE